MSEDHRRFRRGTTDAVGCTSPHMTTLRPIIITLCTVAAACGEPSNFATIDDSDPGADAQESALVTSSCPFGPGCQTTSTRNGPLTFSVSTSADKARLISVMYREDINARFLLCERFPSQPAITLVFIVGPHHARQVVQLPMNVSCPRSYGDNGSAVNWASMTLRETDNPGLWNTLFPLLPDGSRWFAVQVALVNAAGAWDSRYGANYSLVLDRR